MRSAHDPATGPHRREQILTRGIDGKTEERSGISMTVSSRLY
jgi:hypothetical protein